MRTGRRLLAEVVSSLRRSLPQLFGFEFVVRAITWALIIPLSAWLSTRLVSTTGYLAVANTEIVSFLLRPAGLVVLFLVLMTELGSRMLHLAGPMLIDASADVGLRMSAFGALARAVRMLPRLLVLGLHMVGRFLLVAAPLAALGAFVGSRLLSERDIYYYLTVRPTEFWVTAAVAGAVGIIILLSAIAMLARWIYGVPVVLFEGRGGSAALTRSRELSRGSFWRLAALLVAWALALALLVATLSLVADRSGDLAVRAFGERFRLLIPALGLILAVYLALVFLIDVAGSLGLALIVQRLYVERVGGEMPVQEARAAATAHARSAAREAARVPHWSRWAAALTLVVLAGLISTTLAERLDLRDEVEITAHRGSSLRAPENTLAAVELAIAEGADYVEIDVQETADGVVVLLHDRELKRVAGVARNIWEVDYAEIRELDVGSWFGAEFAGERIPTLGEVLQAARGRIMLNVELKYNRREVALAARTVELIREHGMADQVVLTSLNRAGLMEVRALDPALPVGLIVARSVGNPWGLDVEILSVETALVNAATAPRAHRAGMQVHVWSVKDRVTMSRLIDLGADNIITDDPLLARDVLQKRAELSDLERLILYIRSRLAR